jgi:arylformamidase
VLFRTGWDRRWGTDAYWEPGPYLASETLDQLVAGRPALVGVDCWNVDDPADPARPAHTRLLGADIPIVEHLCNLDVVPDDAHTYVVPLAIEGAPCVPVRAFAIRVRPRSGPVCYICASPGGRTPPGGRARGEGRR